MGTAGIAFLYVRDSFVQSLVPTNSGWFAQAEIAAMDITANRPAPNARRFEAGTPAVVNAYASALPSGNRSARGVCAEPAGDPDSRG